jgi:multiple sugar transport system permease protein
MLGFILLTAGPMLASIYLSFTSYDLLQSPRWVGLRNFQRLLTDDERVRNSLKVTTIFAGISVPLNLFLGLCLALILNQRIKLLGLWRTVYYLPALVPAAAMGLLWRFLLDDRNGFVNRLLAEIGISGPRWLSDRDWVVPAFVIMSIWGVGVPMVINLAGLQNIPASLYEAAEIDGATSWQKLWGITLPLLSPVIFFNLVMGVIGALQSFTVFYVVTGGGPRHSSETLMLYLYENAFKFLRMGYASALAWVLFFYILVLTLIVYKFSNRWVYYESPVERREG